MAIKPQSNDKKDECYAILQKKNMTLVHYKTNMKCEGQHTSQQRINKGNRVRLSMVKQQ